MKTIPCKTSRRLVAILAAVTLGAAFLGGAERDRPPSEAEREARPREDADRLALRAGKFLSEEQRARLRENVGDHRERLADLNARLQAARRAFHQAALAGADEGELRPQAKVVAELEVERLMLQAQVLGKIRRELPPGARERLAEREGRRLEKPRADEPKRERAEARPKKRAEAEAAAQPKRDKEAKKDKTGPKEPKLKKRDAER